MSSARAVSFDLRIPRPNACMSAVRSSGLMWSKELQREGAVTLFDLTLAVIDEKLLF